MIKAMLLVLLLMAFSWAAGVRFHPEAVPGYFADRSAPKYHKIEFTTGGSMIGELLGEAGDAVKVRIDGGILTFSKNEIAQMTAISGKEAELELGAEPLVEVAPRPFITFRAEDGLSLFNSNSKSESLKYGSARAPSGVGASASAPPRTAEAAAALAQRYAEAAKQKQRGSGCGKIRTYGF